MKTIYPFLALLLAPQAFADSSEWQILLGGGAFTRPRYPGSDSNEVRALPLIDVTYVNRWFLKTDAGLGAYLYRDENFLVSLSVGPDLERRHEVDDARLRGLGNVSETAQALARASYRFGWARATLSLSSDIDGQGHGTSLDLQLEGWHAFTAHWQFRGGVGLRASNAEYEQTFFGIDTIQSARSGRPQYRADGGQSSLRLFAASTYLPSAHWQLSGQLSASRLLGDAADSPITERKTSRNLALFAAYRF